MCFAIEWRCGFWRCIGQETMHILGTSLVRMEYLQAMKLHDAYGCTLPRTFATNEFENGPSSSTFSLSGISLDDLILFAASKKHRYGPGSNWGSFNHCSHQPLIGPASFTSSLAQRLQRYLWEWHSWRNTKGARISKCRTKRMKKGREQKGCEQDDDDDDVKRNDLTGRNQTSHFTLRRSGSLWPQQWLLPVQRNPGVVQLGANATPLPVLILGCEGLLWFSCGLIYLPVSSNMARGNFFTGSSNGKISYTY